MNVTRFPRAPAAAALAAESSFLVDVQAGSVIDAGALAGILLDFKAERAGDVLKLDAAMPAMAMLRAFATAGRQVEPSSQTLVMWTRRGLLHARCRLERVSRTAGDALVRVSITNVHELLAGIANSERTAADDDARPVARPTRQPVTRKPPHALESGRDTFIARIDQVAPKLQDIVPEAPEPPGPPGPIVRATVPPPLIAQLDAVSVPSPAPRDRDGGTVADAPPRDDRTTLQLIAQRIEEGMRLANGTPPAPLAPATALGRVGSMLTMATVPPQANDNTEHDSESLPPSPLVTREGEVPGAVLMTANGGERISPSSGHVPEPAIAALDEATLQRLLAQAAHDIKTPLSAISAASEIIRDERLGPSGNELYRSYAADIHASARHALDIVDRLMRLPPAPSPATQPHGPSPEAPAGRAGRLDAPAKPMPSKAANFDTASAPAAASKPWPSQRPASPSSDAAAADARATSKTAGNGEATRRLTDVNAMISALSAQLRSLTESRQLVVSLSLDPALPQVLVDAVGLKQTLLNLITNAMKFTPAGGGLHLETSRPDSATIAIAVRDTGRGMTKGAIARLIGGDDAGPPPAPRATPTAGNSTGLGLGIPQVRAFCHEADATLEIDSTLGRGTAVTLTLPATR